MEQYQLQAVNKPTETVRKPISWEKHRHEVRLQIILPLVIGVVILLALSVLVVLGSNAQVSQGADVALIWLIVPMLFLTLLLIIIISALIYGLAKLLLVTPGAMRKLQDYSIIIQYRVSGATTKLVSPVIKIKSTNASLGALIGNIKRKNHN